MSDSPFFEYWKHFHAVSESHNLSSFARLIYYRLLEEFNKGHWELTEIQLTDRDVQRMTNIRSLKSIVDAKSELNRENLMRITNRKNKPTIYELLSPCNRSKHEISTKQARSKHEISTAFINYTQEVEEKDVKTLRPNTNSAGAREGASQISDELNRCWIENVGENPRGGVYIKLLEAEQKYGTEKVVDAVNTAAIYNKEPRLSFAYVLKIIENTQTKGAVKNGRNHQPSTEGNYKWEDPPDLDKY